MEQQTINPKWQIFMLKEQRKYNLILAFGTIILAITSILQIIKIYDFETPNFIFWIFVIIILIALEIILIEAFSRSKVD
jgi:hypothetical protein